MARPILVDPRGGPVEVTGDIVAPGLAPLKIDVWRYVRHPPPEMVHAYSVKAVADDAYGYFPAGNASSLVGKVVVWVWLCEDLQVTEPFWHVRLDVRQDGASTPGFPADYSGALPDGQPLAQLRISEPVSARP